MGANFPSQSLLIKRFIYFARGGGRMDLPCDGFNFRSQMSGPAATRQPQVVLLLVIFACELSDVGGDLHRSERLSDSVDTDTVSLGCEFSGAH